MSPGSVAGYGHCFNDTVRVTLENQAVLERARLTFVSVAHDVLLVALLFGDHSPLQPSREPCASASLELAVGQDLDDLFRLHRQSLGQSSVAVTRNVLVDTLWIDESCVPQDDLLLAFACLLLDQTPA